ncbi:MAG: Txe/YoeB family addiction module toxin [Holosporaceae bacterium]|nr:Txe/YoeB family addiction module toxin [Holosporaceae bacterium]
MVKWRLVYSKRAQKDSSKLKDCGLKEKVENLLQIIVVDPYASPPFFEKLSGVENIYSRRINIRHRLVYEVREKDLTIIVRMMFKHYGD